jgi:hypothetical protein
LRLLEVPAKDFSASAAIILKAPPGTDLRSADHANQVSPETEQAAEAGEGMWKDMPLEGTGMDPETAHDDLAQRVTEDTGAEGDMQVHAERKVDQMANEMLEDA